MQDFQLFTSDHYSLHFDKQFDSNKNDILQFQDHFLASDLTLNDPESDWLSFKHMLTTTINENIPKKLHKSNRHLPWINHSIQQQMRQRKKLYNKAKRLQSQEAWSQYHISKNKIIEEINQAHERYQNNLFDGQTDTHHNLERFCRYIKKLRKDQSGVSSLTINDNPEEKAGALNNQLY